MWSRKKFFTLKKAITFFIVLMALVSLYSKYNVTRMGPGVFAPEEPEQVLIEEAEPFTFKGKKITPLAKFNITAKILSKKNYRWADSSDLVPVDLVLGWGHMSDESILKHVKVKQSHRRGRWRWQTMDLPYPIDKLENQISNMHLIPKDRQILSKINRAKTGDIVKFSGYLVKAGGEGSRWVSSLSRTDSGEGACEVVWVESFSIRSF